MFTAAISAHSIRNEVTSMHMQRRYSKRELLGRLRIDYLFSNDQLPGITRSPRAGRFLPLSLKPGTPERNA